jgi:acyl-coenzyme A thioesterase PaaI-like protein
MHMEPATEFNVDLGDWPEVAGARKSAGVDRMGAALRAIQDSAHGATATDEAAGRVASILEDALRELTPAQEIVTQDDWSADAGSRAENLISPPLRDVRVAEGKVLAAVTFSRYHHGSNGAVHGGSIPLLFDDFLGRIVASSGVRARTAWLRVDYRRITPVEQQLQLSGWISHIEGRKYSVRGELRINDLVTAEADSLFVELRPGAI